MQPIDFVLAWVDGNDLAWRKRKEAYTGTAGTDDSPERYRDWELMRYWFRGVEKYAPWVRRIFFVCDQEPPEWLNQVYSKLTVVRHEDYLPQEYRPAFSANPIELNLHRIRDLSEQFVFFNDDMFLLAPVDEKFFFSKGLPRDAALLNPVPTTGMKKRNGTGRIFTIPLNNAEILNRDYDFRACVKKHPGKWLNRRYGKSLIRNMFFMTWKRFVGFDEPHLPQAFLKSSFEKAWEQDADILAETSRHVLRDDRDVNQWLIRERQLAEGRFMPRKVNVGRVLDLDLNNKEAIRTVVRQEVPMVCLNDGPMEEKTFQQIKEGLKSAFEQILPELSAFELRD